MFCCARRAWALFPNSEQTQVAGDFTDLLTGPETVSRISSDPFFEIAGQPQMGNGHGRQNQEDFPVHEKEQGGKGEQGCKAKIGKGRFSCHGSDFTVRGFSRVFVGEREQGR